MGIITTNRRYVYSELEESLRQKILNGELNHKLPISGEEALARRYGISRPSARKAIHILVKEGLLTRNRGGGTYVIPPANRSMNTANKNLRILFGIAYLNKHGIKEYDEKLLEGASEYACRAGHTMAYFDPADFDEQEILNKWNNNEIDAIVWLALPEACSFHAVERYKKAKIPQLSFYNQTKNIPFIQEDTEKSITRIVQFLHNYGHSKIGFVNSNISSSRYQEMEKGYFSAMKNIVKTVDCKDLYLHSSSDHFDKTFKNIDNYLNNITAIILGGFTFIHPFLNLFEMKKIKIPDDLSVICIDDTYTARSYNPPISVYSKSRVEQGKQMIHVVESLIKGGIAPGEKIISPGELIIRDSCKAINKI
jgi:GntR family transcriptional regulator, arabinose operon transcriptional repressor